MLTGIEIASYGKDFEPQVPLHRAVEKLLTAQPNAVPAPAPSTRGRWTMQGFVNGYFAGLANLARHFHLSMQSGCDTVLRRNEPPLHERGILPVCRAAETCVSGLPGYDRFDCRPPGDRGRVYADTGLLRDARLRPCTYSRIPYARAIKAAAMPGQPDQQTKTARAERQKQVAETLSVAYRKQFVGRTLYVTARAYRPAARGGARTLRLSL